MSQARRSGFAPDELVQITDGIFNGQQGRVRGITEAGLIGVDVIIFGRPIDVAIDAHALQGPELDEGAYLGCRQPHRLVSFLANRLPPPTGRKIALFGCASLRTAWNRLNLSLRRCVTRAEEWADAPPSRKWRESVRRHLFDPTVQGHASLDEEGRRNQRISALLLFDREAWPAWSLAYPWSYPDTHFATLFLDIFGNPFHPVSLDHSWLAWDRGAVVRLARDIYEGRRFDEMPVLGDALEDAGCTDAEILGHCRTPLHARGCWLLDAILGIE